MKVLYSAAFFPEKEKRRLEDALGNSFSWTQTLCHHVTINFQPSKEQIERLVPFLGKSIRIRIDGYREDANCRAAFAHLVKQDSYELADIFEEIEVPHVTIGVNPPTKPKYSAGLLGQPGKTLPAILYLRAQIGLNVAGRGPCYEWPIPRKG